MGVRSVNQGLPLTRMPTPLEIIRFLTFVDMKSNPGHWIWTGAKDKRGYGRFKFDGHTIVASRFSYQVFVGLLQMGEEAHHDRDTCGRSECVNPLCLGALPKAANVAEGNHARFDITDDTDEDDEYDEDGALVCPFGEPLEEIPF